jgi:hypothetical protein
MKDGERGRNRTFNLLIKSQLLCQLSYAPTVGISGKAQTKIIAFNFYIRGSESARPRGDSSHVAKCDRYSPAILHDSINDVTAAAANSFQSANGSLQDVINAGAERARVQKRAAHQLP